LNGAGFLYAFERSGNIVTAHFGNINGVASLMAYQHGASALTELAAYASPNRTLYLDRATNFLFSVSGDVCNVQTFNSSNQFDTATTITAAELDVLDAGMWGSNISNVGSTSVWVHNNAIILNNNSNPLSGRVRRMLVLGSAS
jgi:hypothetical protein